MIYVDHDSELKGRIRRLQALLATLQNPGCDPAAAALQTARGDLQCCERWLELLVGGTRNRRHYAPPDKLMPTVAGGEQAVRVLASGQAKSTHRSNRALPARFR